MERPTNPELDAILATVEEVREAESHILELKARLSKEALAIAGIADKRSRIAAAVYAYWFAPEVHATDLSFAATGRRHASALLKYAGSIPTGITCDRCQAELEITSREQMKKVLAKAARGHPIPEGYRLLCGECWGAVFDARHEDYLLSNRLAEQRRREISAMSYAEYLATEDWAHQRVHYLEFLLRTVKALECETCSAKSGLGLYHKVLPGGAMFDSLILLCEPCMQPLVAADRLAGEPTDRNRVSAALASRLAAQILDE